MSVPDCMYLATFNAFGGDVTPSSWFDHPIHYHPLTQPYIVSQVNLCNNASYNPPGYSVPASLNNAGSGQQMANWRQYYEARLNGPHSAAGKPISPAIYFQNLGQTQDGFTPYPNTSVLCLNSSDKIVTALGLEELWPPVFMITANCAEAAAYRQRFDTLAAHFRESARVLVRHRSLVE